MEGFVEGGEHAAPVEVAVGDLVELFLDFGGEVVVEDGGEVVGEVVGDEHPDVGGEEFVLLGAGGLALLGALEGAVRGEGQDGVVAFRAFAVFFDDVAAVDDGGDGRGVGLHIA